MSSFKFNFNNEADLPSVPQNDSKILPKEDIQWLRSSEIKPDKSILDSNTRAKILVFDDIEICYVNPGEVLKTMKNNFNDIICAENNHSDLITGKYEGGLKVWECTKDLIEYLISNRDSVTLENARILDLGCGSGLLGIYALLNGAHVTFQDYNKEVIECITVPNVFLNIENEEEKSIDIAKCKFYCGDWASFNSLLVYDEPYDMIVTSETIYNSNNYEKLVDIFAKRLSTNGTVYVAAKTYYFGVGGGTRQFEKELQKSGLFKCEVCWQGLGGIQREILKINRICS